MKLIRSLALTSVACTFLSPAFLAYGHETVPQDWCVDKMTTPKIISKFKWDGPELINQIMRCGIVDINNHDLWSAANTAAHFYCEKQSPEDATAVPFIVGPQSYNDKSHHETYSLEEGLAGSCAVCVPQGH